MRGIDGVVVDTFNALAARELHKWTSLERTGKHAKARRARAVAKRARKAGKAGGGGVRDGRHPRCRVK